MKRYRLFTGVGSGLAIAIVAAAGIPAGVGACTTHQCDPSLVCIDSTGHMKSVGSASDCTADTGGTPVPSYNLDIIDDGVVLDWFTSSLFGPWIDFPGQRTYIINLPFGLTGHELLNYYPAVSSDSDAEADVPHMNWTPATGQLSEFVNTGTPAQVSVFNDTCVDYGLRLEVRALAAGADGDAGSGESDGALPEASADAQVAGAAEAGD